MAMFNLFFLQLLTRRIITNGVKMLTPASLCLFFLFFTETVLSDTISDAAYLDGGTSDRGLILCHGRGKNPTWKVVQPLRLGVHERLGYHTLSLQMPNKRNNFKEYARDFPKAYSTIKQAILFLQKKGVKKIYLMGHSMGSRMASAFLAENPDQPIKGLIVAGCRNNGGKPFNCKQNLQNVHSPVLDIWGGAENKDNNAANERSSLQSASYQQVSVVGANHRFEDHEHEFVMDVVEWLQKQDAN